MDYCKLSQILSTIAVAVLDVFFCLSKLTHALVPGIWQMPFSPLLSRSPIGGSGLSAAKTSNILSKSYLSGK